MEAIASSKSVAALSLILLSGVYFSSGQPGFLSLDCGGIRNRRDNKTGITWIPDDNYIQGGRREEFNDSDLEFYQQSSRVFPNPLRKSCYKLPITPNVPFLLRLYFVGTNYSNQTPDFKYSIETEDSLNLRNVTYQRKPPSRSEKILVTAADVLYICLIRTSEDVDPFISSIELRPLGQGMYNPVKRGLMLHFNMRFNFGTLAPIRYPQDPFDRLWDGKDNTSFPGTEIVTSGAQISTENTEEFPPPEVMQTALATYKDAVDIVLSSPTEDEKLLILYFAEIRNSSEETIFDILLDNVEILETVQLVRNGSAIEKPFLINESFDSFNLLKKPISTSGPIINAIELYQIVATSNQTSLRDVEALAKVKKRFNLSHWMSDPCFTIPWEGINCSNSFGIVRVSEIILSGMNLTGSIPSSLANMTALINLSLDNNYLTGSMPDLSQLVKLERLHLQNNSLVGKVPDWLSELHNLKELFIENNNFSGVIPLKLLDANSLKITYEGNHYLCMKKGECQLSSHSNGRRKKPVEVIIVGPIATVGLLLLLVIIIYRKKLRRKDTITSVTRGSAPVNGESIYVGGQDYLSVSVPSTPKSRSFSLDEIMTATKNFSEKIGQGGFGSVFLGEFPEEKKIAVKVLSFFSNQGITQFLNEIELLSIVHHRNLVSLLGYCNASRDLMLVYEYMCGGSLNDHLYGRKVSKYPKLDWKTRLKIALDAAQGLEYLHTNCSPKIIHRDIKTANILLDAKLTGKLADFGLSRVATDDVSHVITAVRGTAGYVDPKYFTTHVLTEKSDVYSFGVVLLEIICGRRPIDITLSEPQMDLVKWVTPFVKADEDLVNISEFVDKSLDNNYKKESIIHVVKLAMRCIESEPSHRPSASDAVMEIKDAIKTEIQE